MAIYVENPKTKILDDESYDLADDTTINSSATDNWLYCAVAFAGSLATASAKVTAPTSGGRIAGIIKDPDASYSKKVPAGVCVLGITPARLTAAAVDAGAELMVGDTHGRLCTATGSGSYVVGRALQGSAGKLDTIIPVEMFGQYKV